MYVGPAVSGLLHLGLLALALAPARPEPIVSPDFGPSVEVELMSLNEYNAMIGQIPQVPEGSAPGAIAVPDTEVAMNIPLPTPSPAVVPDPPTGVSLAVPPVEIPAETDNLPPESASVEADTDAPELEVDARALQDAPVSKADILPDDRVRIVTAPEAPEQPRGVMDAPDIDTDPDQPPEPEELAEPSLEPAPPTQVAEATEPQRNGAPPSESPLPRAKPRGSLAAESSDKKTPASPVAEAGDGPRQRNTDEDQERNADAARDALEKLTRNEDVAEAEKLSAEAAEEEKLRAEDARIAAEDARIAAEEAEQQLAAERAAAELEKAESEAAEEEARRIAEAEIAAAREEDEKARLQAEEDARRAAEEEARRLAEAELEKQRLAEAEALKKAEEELALQRAAAEEAKRLAEEELAAQRAAEEEARRLAEAELAAEEARKLAEAELERERLAQAEAEAARQQAAAELAAQRAAEEAQAARLAEEQRKMREEMAALERARAEEEARRQAALAQQQAVLEQQAAQRAQEQQRIAEEQARRAYEAEQRRLADEAEAARQYALRQQQLQQFNSQSQVGQQTDSNLSVGSGAPATAPPGDSFMAMLGNAVPTQGGGTSGGSRTFSQNVAAQNNAAPLTQGEQQQLLNQLSRCWRVFGTNIDVATIRVNLTREGLVAGETPRGGSPRAIEIAIRALRECQPFPLPPQKYGSWQQLDIVFDPRRMTLQ